MTEHCFKVYKYTNTLNGKVYIGQTKNSLSERAQSNGRNYVESRRFYNAIKKYGWSAFVGEVLFDGLTIDEANQKEEEVIAYYHATDPKHGYNLAPGGFNHEHSAETRRRISNARKQEYQDPTRNPMYGRKHTQEAIQKMSEKKQGSRNPMYGRHLTMEHKQKISSHKPKHVCLSAEQRAALSERGKTLWTYIARPVYCIEDSISFPTLTAAAEHYGVSASTLQGHLAGRQHTCRQKHFTYLDQQSATTIPQGSTPEMGAGGSGEAGLIPA